MAGAEEKVANVNANANDDSTDVIMVASDDLPNTFVSHNQEKIVFPDGRRGIRFYLVDARCATLNPKP